MKKKEKIEPVETIITENLLKRLLNNPKKKLLINNSKNNLRLNQKKKLSNHTYQMLKLLRN
jgi:hypothetical protein